MSRPISDYVAAALLVPNNTDDSAFSVLQRTDFTGDFNALMHYAEECCGFTVEASILRQSIRVLSKLGLVKVTDDPYSGAYYLIRVKKWTQTKADIGRELDAAAGNEISAENINLFRSDYPLAAAVLDHEVMEDFREHGEKWLRRALIGIATTLQHGGNIVEDEEILSSLSQEIPASDRLVRLDHNQIVIIGEKTEELLVELSKKNEINNSPSLKDMIRGQIRAGLELVRSGCIRLYLLQLTFIDTLAYLAKRYEREAVGAAASALLTSLLNMIGQG
ncbi:MAG: hypothetical protein ACK5SX_09425 [Sandaracinobacter sp.]